jgi:hypothetical protein
MNSIYKFHSDIGWSKSARNNEKMNGRVAIVTKGTERERASDRKGNYT